MKKIVAILLMVAATMSGCMKQDLDDIRSRLANLEEWQRSVNWSITSLQEIVMALESKDFVTNITPLVDGSGYVINFTKSGAVTIKHGEKGSTPIIGIKKDTDNIYYWTIDGEFILNDGVKFPVSGKDGTDGKDGIDGENGADGENGTDGKDGADGENGTDGKDGADGKDGENGTDGTDGKDAIAPQLRINATDGNWEISTDGGASWTSTGVKAQGDAIFAAGGMDNSNDDFVELTLADGKTKIQLPKYKMLRIGKDGSNEPISITTIYDFCIDILIPADFKEADYTAMMAQVISNQGTGSDVLTRAATSAWSVKMYKPTFTPQGVCNNDAMVSVDAPDDIEVGEIALLEVTLVGKNGSKTVSSRALKVTDLNTNYDAVGEGTQNDPYLIYNSDQLFNIAGHVGEGEDMFGLYFKQTNNIDLINTEEWMAIGMNENYPFKGNYDGDGNKVINMAQSGLYWMETSPLKYYGLFGVVEEGSVKNLTVHGSVLQLYPHQSDDIYIATIIGYLKSGTASNLSAKATMAASSGERAVGNMYIGGAIGKADVALSSDDFEVEVSLNCDKIDGDTDNSPNVHIGHNVGWCNNTEMDTKTVNAPYAEDDDSFTLIFGDQYNGKTYINGYSIN